MQFGYFDDENHEYVITRPDTPKAWSNYLGSAEYGGIITNNAGGYSFYKSAATGRFTRFRFNSIPAHQPGRYVYFHDHGTKDFWSASWQPAGKPLDRFESVCRHGTGYTVIESRYSGIRSEVTYFVPLGKTFEIWKVSVTNISKKKRMLSAFTYLEYAASWNAADDLLNVRNIQYNSRMKVTDGIVDHGTYIGLPSHHGNKEEKGQGRHTFQAIVGAGVVGFETDREAFLGPYRTYANPFAVQRGKCSGSLGYGDNPCGVLQVKFSVQPGASAEFLVIAGAGSAESEGREAVVEFSDLSRADSEMARLKSFWHERLSAFTAKTPDPELNSTINTWGIYNSLVAFEWPRSANLIDSGVGGDGFGYRDMMQDLLGVIQVVPDDARLRLELMLSRQVSTGGAMPVVIPFNHDQGKGHSPREEDYRADDSLWMFDAIQAYVNETGDVDFYRKVIPFADKGNDFVFGHMKRAIQFNLSRTGDHGLPSGLLSDWNDTLHFGRNGESIFTAMQLRHALRIFIDVALLLQKAPDSLWAKTTMARLDENIQRDAWDGEWFIRGYAPEGSKLGSKDCKEGQIFLNPQTWSVLSGLGRPDQAESAMNQVHARLASDYGLALCDPPFTEIDKQDIARAAFLNPGLSENGGIIIHSQPWAVIAEAMLGHGSLAYEYLRAYLPAAYNKRAQIRETEPYVMSQSTDGRQSPKHGVSRFPWLSGAASWTYFAITQYVLGVRPEISGIRIDPCIPSKWKSFTVRRVFRGKTLIVQVENPNGVERGVKRIMLNGGEVEGNLVPVSKMLPENELLVTVGSEESKTLL